MKHAKIFLNVSGAIKYILDVVNSSYHFKTQLHGKLKFYWLNKIKVQKVN